MRAGVTFAVRLFASRSKWFALAVAAATLAVTSPASAYHEDDERIVDATAHTLRAGEVRIGIWELELGPVAFATIGTDTAPWAASFLLGSVVENGHAKVRLLRTTPLTISVSAAVYHAELQSSGPVLAGSGSLLLVPLSMFASSDLSHAVSMHLGVTYAYADSGQLDLAIGSSRARTTIAASAVQLHAMGEFRVSRVVALMLQVHAQPYATSATVRMSTTDALGQKIDFVGTAAPVDRTAFAAVASIAFSGRHLNARIGGGYGSIFLPSMGVVIPITTVLPEIDAYVRF
jgi:hypothetical protein